VAEQGQLRLLAVNPPAVGDRPAGSRVATAPASEVPATSAAGSVRAAAAAMVSSVSVRSPDATPRAEAADVPVAPPQRADAQAGALAAATRAAVTQQRGLAPLLADLAVLVAQPDRVVPAPVRAAAASVLGLRVDAQTVSANDLRAALTRSG